MPTKAASKTKKKKVKITYEPVKGTIERFYIFVGGERILYGDGNKKKSKSGSASGTLSIEVTCFGSDSAKYKIGIDLPGTVNDQEMTFQLTKGYHRAEFKISVD